MKSLSLLCLLAVTASAGAPVRTVPTPAGRVNAAWSSLPQTKFANDFFRGTKNVAAFGPLALALEAKGHSPESFAAAAAVPGQQTRLALAAMGEASTLAGRSVEQAFKEKSPDTVEGAAAQLQTFRDLEGFGPYFAGRDQETIMGQIAVRRRSLEERHFQLVYAKAKEDAAKLLGQANDAVLSLNSMHSSGETYIAPPDLLKRAIDDLAKQKVRGAAEITAQADRLAALAMAPGASESAQRASMRATLALGEAGVRAATRLARVSGYGGVQSIFFKAAPLENLTAVALESKSDAVKRAAVRELQSQLRRAPFRGAELGDAIQRIDASRRRADVEKAANSYEAGAVAAGFGVAAAAPAAYFSALLTGPNVLSGVLISLAVLGALYALSNFLSARAAALKLDARTRRRDPK